MKKRTEELTPVKAIAEGLALIGKPFYFVISRAVIAILFLFTTIIRIIVVPGKPKKKKGKKLPAKIKFPKFDFLKLETLRISLFELKIISRIKKLISKPAKTFKKKKPNVKLKISFIFVFFVFLILGSYFLIFKGLPSPRELTKRSPEVSTKIYDRNGDLLYKIYKDKNRTIIPITQIPPHVRLATLAAEDAEFYSHPGFSIRGIVRALSSDIQTGSLQGGSTITQQLVKNAFFLQKEQ